MAAQDRMGVRFGWRRGVDRGAGLGPAAAGDSVRGGEVHGWHGWHALESCGLLWVVQLVSRPRKRTPVDFGLRV